MSARKPPHEGRSKSIDPAGRRRQPFGDGILGSVASISEFDDAAFERAEPYFRLMRQWLELEGHAERERMVARRQIQNRDEIERRGETLLGMNLIDHRVGLAGRYLLDFSKPAGGPLPMNRLKVGSPVVVSDDANRNDDGVPGVVSARKANVIQVATEKWPEGQRHRIDLSPDETTRKRQLAAMTKAGGATGRSGKLRDILLGIRPLKFDDPSSVSIDFLSPLNPPQQDAVRFVLAARDFAVIHGPPGTGKTTTLAEVVAQAVRRGERVLACAPSNTGVDNLMERLIPLVKRVVRVGHPARVFESLRGHTLDELVESDPANAVIADMKREIDQLTRAAGRKSGSRDAYLQRGEMFAQAGVLRGQIRSLERSLVHGILDAAEVICTTTTIDDDLLGGRDFDTVVIDEACQCTEPGIWQAILRAERVILAGDHCQLPPTVLSDEAVKLGMKRSTMQRLIQREGETIFRRLTVQYRMNRQIMRFSSQEFYDNQLIADASVGDHLLCDLKGIQPTRLTEHPLHFIDTAGADLDESLEPDGLSKLNQGEARLIKRLVDELIRSGVPPHDIAIIAPYAAQVRLIRGLLDSPGIEIDTVDGFQGREKEVVLLTMVRSNTIGEIGFLADTRRTNVAITRARRKLIMVGDSATLSVNPFYARLLQAFEAADAYHSVWEFDDWDD